ncbi:hypothetical protein [Spirosoma arcticum]
MNAVQIPLSEPAIERFQQLPKPKQALLKIKVAALLEQELGLAATTSEHLTAFQEAMQMTDEDMLLTFGADYLSARNWVATHA